MIIFFSCVSEKSIGKAKVFFKSDSSIRSAILIDNGKLYFGNENCEFYAVDIKSGKKRWVYSTDVPVQTWPVSADGKILFNAGNSLYVLDSENGNQLIKFTYPCNSSSRVSNIRYAFNDSYTAVSQGMAYYAALNGDIVAVDLNTGEMAWSFPAEKPDVVASGINYWDGKLYYVDSQCFLCCLDIRTRAMLFKVYIGDRVYAPLTIDDGKIYAGGRSCKTYCVNACTGDIIWSSHSETRSTWFSGGSVVIGNDLYACTSDEHSIAVFDKDTGDLKRLYPTETNAYTKPVLNGENIVVAASLADRDAYIMEFDTKTHEKLWQVFLPDRVVSSPAIYKGVLYFGSDSGTVHRINLQ
jgi:outer membrane protein assembly factor BamB